MYLLPFLFQVDSRLFRTHAWQMGFKTKDSAEITEEGDVLKLQLIPSTLGVVTAA